MKHNLEEFMRENHPPLPSYPTPEEMDQQIRAHRLISEAAGRLVAVEDDLILAAHFRARELGVGVLVRNRGELDFRRDGESLTMTCLTEAEPDPSVPKGQIHYAPKEDS